MEDQSLKETIFNINKQTISDLKNGKNNFYQLKNFKEFIELDENNEATNIDIDYLQQLTHILINSQSFFDVNI